MSPLHGAVAEVPAAVLDRLAALCPLETAPDAVTAVSRDWWPLAMIWEQDGTQVTPPAAVVRPTTADGLAAVLRVCNEARVPVTATAGRSGVCGASMPVHGGVVLDLTALTGIVDVDDTALVLDVRAGTFGTPLEATLRRDHHVTLGHWPQSIDLSTVGGWLACRSAGQMSTRYGKIEDMVLGLDVVLADGRMVHTGGAPRAAVGPDLTQLFVGSEGTLGVITGARLRVHPAPAGEVRAAFRFTRFEDGLDACRRILRRGATPAVLRLYDAIEGERHFSTRRRGACSSSSTRATPRSSTRCCRSCATNVATRRRTTPRCSTCGSSTATTSPRSSTSSAPASWSTRWRSRRAWSALPRVYRRRAGRVPGCRRHGAGVGAPLARVPRRRLPLLHLRRSSADGPT